MESTGRRKTRKGKGKGSMSRSEMDPMCLKKRSVSEAKEGTSQRPRKQEIGSRNGEEKSEEKGKSSLSFSGWAE
jgi:hypothetical protein